MYLPSAIGRSKRKRIYENDLPVQIRICGELLEVKNGKAYSPMPIQEPGRKIAMFTPSARLRLTKRLLQINYEKTPTSVCITLTYPDAVLPRDKDRRALDLQLMLRHIEKYLGKQVYGVWRTEWEVRKDGVDKGKIAPHIHLILFGVIYIHWKRIRKWWKDVVHWQLYVRTEIKRAGSKRKTLRYLCKYVKKAGEASLVYAPNYGAMDGKHYGWVRPGLMPCHEVEWIEEPSQEQLDYLFRRHHEVMTTSDTRPGESFSLMGEPVIQAAQLIRQMCLTPIGK